MDIGAQNDSLAACLLDKRAVPGAVVTIQTFGDFFGFHPHLHIYRLRNQ